MAKRERLTRAEKKEIKRKRKILRKDLRRKGITKYKDFETIARQLGLSLWSEDSLGLIPLLSRALQTLSGIGLIGLMAVIALILGGVFLYAQMANEKGNFTINVSGDLLQVGFDLSDTEDFAHPKVRLKSDILKEVNAYTIEDMPDNLDSDYEGSHNLDNVVAYTFWIRNAGEEVVDYDWYMVLNSVSKNVDQATWVMIYDEGKQTIYAKPTPDGEAEHLSGFSKLPLMEQAANPEEQYYTAADGTNGIRTTPYIEDRIVGKGTFENLQPGEKHKYTVVIWVEGNDPECTNDILGGHAGYAMKFVVAGDKKGIFDDLMFENLYMEE